MVLSRHHLLFAFNRVAKATKTTREICVIYGEDAIAERFARHWFANLKSGNLDLKDASRSGQQSELDEEYLNQLLHEDLRQTTTELAEHIGSNKSRVMGKVKKFGTWVSHALLQFACWSFLNSWTHKQRFLYRTVTGDKNGVSAST